VQTKPIFRIIIQSKTLFDQYPSRWHDEYKKKIFAISCPENCKHNGELEITRWKARPVLAKAHSKKTATKIITYKGPFKYEPTTKKNSAVWHLNFADGDLFFSYGSSLMAQDELQVAEHPILASVREMLASLSENNRDYDPCTRDYTSITHNPPTPILITGVERRLSIDLSANPETGRENGLYGNMFRAASWEVIRKILSKISPPTVSNIIAMEAPPGGKNRYTEEQINDVFQTAFTAFSAAREESLKLKGEKTKTIINTGDWGTGAYGGNKVLMAVLQLLAATTAQIDMLNFYTNDHKSFAEAQILIDELIPTSNFSINIPSILTELFNMEFQWGVSDGN